MNKIFLIILLAFSPAAFSLESLRGTFEIDNTQYEIVYTYNILLNQAAESQNIRIFDNVVLPDQIEPIPAYCALEMAFPATVNVVIKKASTAKVVYERNSTEYLYVNSYLGFAMGNQCSLKVSSLKEKLKGSLRVTEKSLTINGKAFRYFMDTYLSIEAYGTVDDLAIAEYSTPAKGSDGKKDGEVWLDTQPAHDGTYERKWFTLSL